MKLVVSEIKTWSSSFNIYRQDCEREFKRGYQLKIVPPSFADASYLPKTKTVCAECAKQKYPEAFRHKARRKREPEPELFQIN